MKKLLLISVLLWLASVDALIANEFNAYWHDGTAEISSYDYTITRYGKKRQGNAVMIFVTEDFDAKAQTKTNSKRSHNVIKLNFIRDFPTGIYDYNMMTSTFVALYPDFGRLIKSSFSLQEWCGNIYSEITQDSKSWNFHSKSYFEGENNINKSFKLSEGSFTEDQIFMAVREMSVAKEGPILMSQFESRMNHKDMSWRKLKSIHKKTVAQKGVSTLQYEFKIDNGVTYNIVTQAEFPYRIIRWKATYDGLIEEGELVKTKKLKYWELKKPKDISKLKEIGLKPRTLRTP